jgi:hypothetical protein
MRKPLLAAPYYQLPYARGPKGHMHKPPPGGAVPSIPLHLWPEMPYNNTKGKNYTICGFGLNFEKNKEFFPKYWIIVPKSSILK